MDACSEATSVTHRHKLLASPFQVRVCAVPGKGNALFAASAFEEGSIVLWDQPLCWQPLEASEENCVSCGTFLGTCGEQFSRLSGKKLALPDLPDAPGICKAQVCGGGGTQKEMLC